MTAMDLAGRMPLARILVVDDDELMALLVQRMLNGAGYECEVARSGEEALVSLNSQQFDLVISDIVLPHLRGTDLVRELRKQIPRIPVVLMTAYTSIPSAVDAMSEGAFSYLAKPPDEKQLLLAVGHALEMSQLRRENDQMRAGASILRNISHEIRTPLNAILNGAELVVDALDGQDPDDSKLALTIIENGCSRLQNAVDELLEMAALESRSLNPSAASIVLSDAVQQIAEEFLPSAKKKGLSLKCEIENAQATIMFDQQGLDHAIRKIVDNAIKFTEHGGVSLRVYRNPQGAFCLDVSDTGIGISTDKLPDLLAPFSQAAGGYTRPYQGLGLGLAIAKRQLELNGGRLSAYSELGEGSTFTLVFPSSAAVRLRVAPNDPIHRHT